MPTRHRVRLVQRFLDSLAAATDRLDEIEVVLGVDDDDDESHRITHDKVALKIVIVPRGLTMGELGQRSFAASSGRFVFAMNDDMMVETKGWDTRVREVLQRFPDEVVLVHVNDDLFGKKLCCFPILSRKTCLEIGYFAPEYRRYKIDDHIYETYTLLARLGYNRVVFLEDVVFRHDNFEESHAVGVAQTAFFAPGGKRYAPNMAILPIDQREYERQIDVRKHNARKLADLIERERYAHAAQRAPAHSRLPPASPAVWYEERTRHRARLRSHTNMLAGVRDAYTHRVSHLSEMPPRRGAAMRSRLGIVLLADDLAAPSARRSLASLRLHARGIALSAVSGNGQNGFSPAQAAGQALAASGVDFLLLMAAGIVLEAEWIELLLESLNEQTAIVAPIYRDAGGSVISSGVYLDDDRPDWPRDHVDVPSAATTRRAVRQGLMLIDLAKFGNQLVDPAYFMHFFDLDLCLRAWESGFAVVCTPLVSAGLPAAAEPDPASARLRRDADAAVFAENWILSGRLGALARPAWSGHPGCMLIPPEPALPAAGPGSQALWLGRLMAFIKANPHALRLAMQVSTIRRRCIAWHGRLPGGLKQLTQPWVDAIDNAYGRAAAAQAPQELGNYRGYRLAGLDGVICAIPSALSGIAVNAAILQHHDVMAATSEAALRARIDQYLAKIAGSHAELLHGTEADLESAKIRALN